MIEETVSRNGVIAMLWWVATGALYVVAGAVMLTGHWKVAILIAEVACGTSAYAAVRHVRCYSAHVCQKIDRLELERDLARLTGLPRQRIDG